MAQNSNIEWTHATFNPWMGCTKVSPACDHCYASVSTATRRTGVVWGAGMPRRRTSEANWKLPLRWNDKPFVQCMDCRWSGDLDQAGPVTGEARFHPQLGQAKACPNCQGISLRSERRRVFCASLADVFDKEVTVDWLVDLLHLIRITPNLDWLLLTKRIGIVRGRLALAAEDLRRHIGRNKEQQALLEWIDAWLENDPPANVWLGATICNQDEAERDIPKLLATPAAVRFLSMEPLLGPVDFRWTPWAHQAAGQSYRDYLERKGSVNEYEALRQIDWIIVGGESGSQARPMHPDWYRGLRDQCQEARVPFLFKQHGEWVPATSGMHFHPLEGMANFTPRAGGKDTHDFGGGYGAVRVGKKLAGRMLDGAHHDGYPSSSA